MNIKSKKGFTLVEIMAAALIITIAALGTFSAYVLARKFSNKFAYKSQATKIAAAVADDLRYRLRFEDNAGNELVINDADGNGDPTDDGANDTVNTYYTFDVSGYNEEDLLTGLTAEYTVAPVWFTNPAGTIIETSTDPNSDGDGKRDTRDPSDPPYFKKITVKVSWTEPV